MVILLIFVVAHRYVLGIGMLIYVIWGVTGSSYLRLRRRSAMPTPPPPSGHPSEAMVIRPASTLRFPPRRTLELHLWFWTALKCCRNTSAGWFSFLQARLRWNDRCN